MKKLAFLILAHNDEQHLLKLISALNYKSDFYVHIDAKSDIKKFEELISLDNVFFIKERVSVSWAGISMIDAIMNLYKEVLKKSDEYTHTVLITGSCYPLRNIKNMHDLFLTNPKKEFVNFIDMRESPEHYMTLINQKWFKEPLFVFSNDILKKVDKGVRFLLNKLKLKNNWDPNIIPYMGHTWCALTIDCTKYVQDYHINNQWFREMNYYTFASDEHYIHTIIGNSHFFESNECLLQFKGRGLYQYTSIYHIDPSLQKWFDVNDWEEISQTDKLFVRKVNSKTGNELVEKINKELLK